MLPFADVVFLAVPAVAVCVWYSWSRVSRQQVLLRSVLTLYVVGVIGVTMFPLPVVPSEIRSDREDVAVSGHTYVLRAGRDYNLIPGHGFIVAVRTAREAAQYGHGFASEIWLNGRPYLANLVMLLPLGYFLPWISTRWRRWWRTTLMVLACTTGIEVVQLLATLAYGFAYRRADVDDLLLNTLGGLAGYGLWKLTTPHLGSFGKREPTDIGEPTRDKGRHDKSLPEDLARSGRLDCSFAAPHHSR